MLPAKWRHGKHNILSFVKSQFSLHRAVASLECNGAHSHVFADFRRLAAKTALAFLRNSFFFLRRLISFDRFFTCFRSSMSFSFIVIAWVGV